MPRSLLLILVGTAVGSVLMYLFYAAVRTRWPSNYASSSNDFGMIVNRTVFRYAAFALGPPYVVALLVSTTVRREGGAGMVVALLIGVFHVCYLRVPETYRTLRYNHTAMRMPTIVMEAGLALGALVVAVLGGLGPGRLTFVIPSIDELFKSLWGTIFVAILAAIVIAKTNVQLDVDRLMTRSRREVGPRLRELARSEAMKVSADADLVEAVLLTENLQRPEWFRQLERIKGRLFPRGSYGVMQVTADGPISDEDSIVRAVAHHLRGSTLVRNARGGVDNDSLTNALAHYNNDAAFAELAGRIFWLIDHENRVKQRPDIAVDDGTLIKAAPREDTDKIETDTESKERAELLGQAASLCMLAAATLSMATVDELRSLNRSVGTFVVKQAERSRTQNADSNGSLSKGRSGNTKQG